jgi:hypothetical protein
MTLNGIEALVIGYMPKMAGALAESVLADENDRATSPE